MNEFLKMDIFFVISSVIEIVLAVLLIVLLVYVIKFVKNLKYISDKARTETDNLSQDINDLRQSVKKKGFQLIHAMNFVSAIIKRIKKGK